MKVINVMIILSLSMFIFFLNSSAVLQSWDCYIACIKIQIKSLLRIVAAILFLSFKLFFFSIINNYFIRYLLAFTYSCCNFILYYLNLVPYLIIIFTFKNKYLPVIKKKKVGNPKLSKTVPIRTYFIRFFTVSYAYLRFSTIHKCLKT